MQKERWQVIPDTDGQYEASTYGNIWSNKTARLLEPSSESAGYQTVKLFTPQYPQNGRTFRVHVLIALTFHGPKPEGLEICHYDDNPENNYVDNLRYDTRENNRMDAFFNRNPDTQRIDPITSVIWWCPVRQRLEIDFYP